MRASSASRRLAATCACPRPRPPRPPRAVRSAPNRRPPARAAVARSSAGSPSLLRSSRLRCAALAASALGSPSAQPIASHPAHQDAASDPEQLGCVRLVIVTLLEGADDTLAFELLHLVAKAC